MLLLLSYYGFLTLTSYEGAIHLVYFWQSNLCSPKRWLWLKYELFESILCNWYCLYICLQLLERFAGRHVSACLLSCPAARCVLQVVASLLNMHIYPCNSWPSWSSQELLGTFVVSGSHSNWDFFFPPEILLLSTRNPNYMSLFGASLPFPVPAIPLSDSRTALTSRTWSFCWWLKFCHLCEGRHTTHEKGETVPGYGKKCVLFWTFWTQCHNFFLSPQDVQTSGDVQKYFSSCLDGLILAKT